MKAVVKTKRGYGNIEVIDVPEPGVGPGEVKIEVKAAGVCGTDIHILHDAVKFLGRLPLVLGHEFSGLIAEVGPGVKGIEVGDRVTSEPTSSSCGRCRYCSSGAYNRCPERMIAGVRRDGAFTNFVVIRAESIHKLPDNVSFEAAAMTEPTAVCVHGLTEQARVSATDVVLISGPGTIGLLACQVARAEGATVIVSGMRPDQERLKLALKLGAARVVKVDEEDLQEVLLEMSEGYGVDMAVEAAGALASARACLKAICKGGTVVQLGLFGEDVPMDLDDLAWKEARYVGSFAQKRSAWQKALKLMGQGLVRQQPLVSSILPITEWREGFEKTEKKEAQKVLLTPVD